MEREWNKAKPQQIVYDITKEKFHKFPEDNTFCKVIEQSRYLEKEQNNIALSINANEIICISPHYVKMQHISKYI